MSNLEQYTKIFVETFGVDESVLSGYEYHDTESWDSVGHMVMISKIEDAFDIMMETDDIIDLSSFEKGKEVLARYDVVI